MGSSYDRGSDAMMVYIRYVVAAAIKLPVKIFS
jgi:hypothetical protein